MTMRNIININEDWKFIREDAGLPAAYPAAFYCQIFYGKSPPDCSGGDCW